MSAAIDRAPTVSSVKAQGALDTAGATASVLCAIHCAAMPLVITLLPLIGLGFLADDRTEWLLFGLSALLGLSSLCGSYFREHRSHRALVVLAVGLSLLALGHIVEDRIYGTGGVALVVLGGLTVAAAHAVNHALCRSCHRCRAAKS